MTMEETGTRRQRENRWQMRARVVLSGMVAGSLIGFALPAVASAAGPQPPTCWGQTSFDGQTAAQVLSSIGAYGQPGLSAFNHGGVAAFEQYVQSFCGF
jgi:hypothetical protein